MAADMHHRLEVGSTVEYLLEEGLPIYGVIRWIGWMEDKLVAGLELEEELSTCSDGTLYGVRYFTCPLRRGFFALLEQCRQDCRFVPDAPASDASYHCIEDMTVRKLRTPHSFHSPANVAATTSWQKVKNSKPSGHRDDPDVGKQHEEEDMKLRSLRRPPSHHSAVNVVAEKSRKTDTSPTIAQLQRQLFGEVKSSKSSGHRDDQDVAKQHGEEDMTVGSLRRPHSYHSAVNVAAAKPWTTDTSLFIAQQHRQIYGKVKNSKPSGHRDDQDVAEQHGGEVHTEKNPNGDFRRQLREQHLTTVQEQLQEKVLQEVNLREQLREENQQKENLQRELREMEQLLMRTERRLREKGLELENSERLSREVEQRLTNLQGQLHVKELQEASLQVQMREKCQQEENSRRQLRETEQQLANLQGLFREKGDEATNLQQQVATLEDQLKTKDRHVNELERTLLTAQQAMSERQRQQSPDWVISRDKIQLKDRLLGMGGWGRVVEGKYCGCAVAVKQIYELILSAHNRNLFEREMNIASRCRHPCLLQFIGATNDEGSPLFVTELMESSLRALLEQRALTTTEVSVISLDVARALSYLHQKTPPIIHRDISSANVLLWRQGDQWRCKVSDCGTANFMQHTMTAAPGARIYSAPEALTSSQTVKVDVYSFGVLLCEMCIQELPDPERRDQQIVMVKNHVFRALIRGCVHSEPGSRPNMEEIIEELEEPV